MKLYHEFCVATMLFLNIFLVDVVIYNPQESIMQNKFPYTWLYIINVLTLTATFIFVICDYIQCYIHSFKICLFSLLINNFSLVILRLLQTYYWKKVVEQEELYTVFQCIMIVGQCVFLVKVFIELYKQIE